MIFVIRWRRQGTAGHVHCVLFVGKRRPALARAGFFVLRDEELEELKGLAPFMVFEEAAKAEAL